MKIVIAGGSGQVGSILERAFIADEHEIVILSRYPGNAPWKVVNWDAQSLGDWTSELETADMLINLAGRNVNCRYHETNHKLIMASRVRSTQVIGEAIPDEETYDRHDQAGPVGAVALGKDSRAAYLLRCRRTAPSWLKRRGTMAQSCRSMPQ